MRKIVLVLLVAITVTACSEPRPRREYAIGKIIRVETVCTSFNEAPKSRVVTEGASMVVFGNASLPLGVEAYLVTTDAVYLSYAGQPEGRTSYTLAR